MVAATTSIQQTGCLQPEPLVQAECHIASLVLWVMPDMIHEPKDLLASLDEAEMAAGDESGRMVVVIETDSGKRILNIIDQLSNLPSVLSCQMVFHQVEPIEALEG